LNTEGLADPSGHTLSLIITARTGFDSGLTPTSSAAGDALFVDLFRHVWYKDVSEAFLRL
jgi:hypothetical protein